MNPEKECYNACGDADWERVEYYLQNGVEIEEVEGLYGSLIEAAMISGDGEFVSCLIANGVTLQPDHLHLAAAVANQNVILCIHKHFLERKWPVQGECGGVTPLQILEARIADPNEWDDLLVLNIARFGMTHFSDEP